MHHFFVDEASLPRNEAVGQVVVLDAITHQLHTVLRLRAGTQILLLDGSGRGYVTEVHSLDRHAAQGVILAIEEAEPPAHSPVTLYQCSLKADKFEWVLQKATELGVARVVPVISARSIVRPAARLLGKYARWETIIREAAEQCGRRRLPELAPPQEFGAAVAGGRGLRLLAWEAAPASEGVALRSALAGAGPAPAPSLLIGPEGGFAAEEVAVARETGWQIVSLGGNTLRAETAAIVAVAVTVDRLGEAGING